MLADDHNMARQGFRAYLETDARFKITGEAANGLELIERLKLDTPDIVLLDLEMPLMSGLETLAVLKEEYPSVKAIILSSHYHEFLIAELMIAGAYGYLPKSCFGDDLFETVIKVYEEGYYFSQSVSKQVINTLISDKKLQHLIIERALSRPEIEVLRQICNEKQAKEIATLLQISETSVEFHEHNLYANTKADSVVGLVKYAIRTGIVSA